LRIFAGSKNLYPREKGEIAKIIFDELSKMMRS